MELFAPLQAGLFVISIQGLSACGSDPVGTPDRQTLSALIWPKSRGERALLSLKLGGCTKVALYLPTVAGKPRGSDKNTLTSRHHALHRNIFILSIQL